MPKKLTIRSEEEFERLLDSLSNELAHANIYFKLHSDLNAAFADYLVEINQSTTFWILTRQALLDATLSRLCRVYDTYETSNSLSNLLHIIKANLHIFDEMNFKKRLKDNPFVDSLAEYARKPDPDQLEEDLKYVGLTNPLVKTLIAWRHNVLAHRNADIIIREQNLSDKFPFSRNDIEELLSKGMSIMNHYNGLFKAVSHSTQIVGHDDFKYVLTCIRETLKRREEELEAERKRYSIQDAI